MLKLKSLLLESKNGDCYQVAGRFIMDADDNHRLVHGMVDGQGALSGIRFGHAWIEYKNKVIDNSNGHSIRVPKDLYYVIGNIKSSECKYYTPAQAMTFMVKKKHFGPWEMSGDPVKLTEDIPVDKREIGKRKIKIPNSILGKLNV